MSNRSRGLSADETLKAESRYLRGTISDSLRDPVSGGVDADDAKLLKFHGTYLQDNRDLRIERQRQKLEPAYQFMVRVRMPGGVCTPKQWLELDKLARRYAGGSLRITTRQTFQYHGVHKQNLQATIAGINYALLSTIAACGDVNRNVVCHNNPYLSPVHAEIHEYAKALSDAFLPATGAYHEIWLEQPSGRLVSKDEEPLYGDRYLPRKFKIGMAIPPHNEIDVLAQDLGLIAIAEQGVLQGFNVTVGGGMGMSHGEPATYPRLGDVIGYVPKADAIAVANAVLCAQRDLGDRSNRKHARLKYTIDDLGLDRFRREVEQRYGKPLASAREYRFKDNSDNYGWAQGSDGLWHLTLFVLSGRIRDVAENRLLTGLREIAKIHRGSFRLTCNQNLIIAGITEAQRPIVEELLAKHNVRITDPAKLSGLRLNAMSCVALPTCGLAMAESERMLPGLLDRLEGILCELGLEKEPITLRVTGCPNGCARPYTSEIGIVGKAPDRYNLFLGAGFSGERLNRLYRESVSSEELVATLHQLFQAYCNERASGEHFGDFAVRKGYITPINTPAKFQLSEGQPSNDADKP